MRRSGWEEWIFLLMCYTAGRIQRSSELKLNRLLVSYPSVFCLLFLTSHILKWRSTTTRQRTQTAKKHTKEKKKKLAHHSTSSWPLSSPSLAGGAPSRPRSRLLLPISQPPRRRNTCTRPHTRRRRSSRRPRRGACSGPTRFCDRSFVGLSLLASPAPPSSVIISTCRCCAFTDVRSEMERGVKDQAMPCRTAGRVNVNDASRMKRGKGRSGRVGPGRAKSGPADGGREKSGSSNRSGARRPAGRTHGL